MILFAGLLIAGGFLGIALYYRMFEPLILLGYIGGGAVGLAVVAGGLLSLGIVWQDRRDRAYIASKPALAESFNQYDPVAEASRILEESA